MNFRVLLFSIFLLNTVSCNNQVNTTQVKNNSLVNTQIDTYLSKGLRLSDENKFDDAIKEFRKILDIDKSNYRAYYEIGRAYYYQKNFDEAEKNLNESVEINSNYYHSYTLLGNIASNKKDYPKALKNLLKLVELNQGLDEIAYQNLGVIYHEQNNIIEAEKWFKRTLQSNSKNKIANSKLASIYSDIRPEESITYYNKSLELSENNLEKSDIYNSLGWVYNKLNKIDFSLENYKKAIETDENNKIRYFNLATIYYNQGNYEEAEKHYLKSLEKDSNFFKSNLALGDLYASKEQKDKAEFYYQKAISIEPNNYEVYNQIGLLYLKNKIYDKAEINLKKSMELNNKYEATYYNLANLSNLLERPKDEEYYYTKVTEINPNDKLVWNILGKLYSDSSQYKKAEESYIRAISIDNNFQIAKDNLKQLNTRNEEYGSYTRLGLITNREPVEVESNTNTTSQGTSFSIEIPLIGSNTLVPINQYKYGTLTCTNNNFNYLNSFIILGHPKANGNYAPFVSTDTNLKNYEYSYFSNNKDTIKMNLYEKENTKNNKTVLDVLRKIKIEMGYQAVDCSILVIKCTNKNECEGG